MMNTRRGMAPQLEQLPMVIVHRLGEAAAPENTLAACADTALAASSSAARADGAVAAQQPTSFWVETDLRATLDGEIVLLHDELVDRTTDGSGKVSEITFQELQQLSAGKWLASRAATGESWMSWTSDRFVAEKVPTLSALLDTFADSELGFMLEVKGIGDDGAAKVVAEIQERPELLAAGRVIVIGFSPEPLEQIKALDPTIPVGYTVSEPTDENIARAVAMKAKHVGVAGSFITPDLVTELNGKGLDVRWTGTFHSTEIRPRQPEEPEQWTEIARLVRAGVCGIVHSDGRILEHAIRSAAPAAGVYAGGAAARL